MRGAGEDLLDLARIAAVVRHRPGPVERDVARRLRPELRRIRRQRRARIGDGGKLLVVDRDLFGGVLRLRDCVSATTSATGWPTCITRSRASAGRNGMISLAPLRPTSGGCTEVEPTPAASSSVWVSTATTPGAARAASMSIDRDARMRMRRAHEHAVGLIRLRRVLDEAPEPAHQRVVLDARLEMMIVRVVSFTETSLDPGCQS